MPAVSYARALWRFGEPGLARRAAGLSPSQCDAIGERAGQLHDSGDAARLWPNGPSGVATAVMLAAIEYLEGKARPCARARRLPEKSLPEAWRLTKDELWQEFSATFTRNGAEPPPAGLSANTAQNTGR